MSGEMNPTKKQVVLCLENLFAGTSKGNKCKQNKYREGICISLNSSPAESEEEQMKRVTLPENLFRTDNLVNLLN